MGESESWKSKRLIARVEQAGSILLWHQKTEKGIEPLFPEQTGKVVLQAGQSYYVEILHKHRYGGDHFAVAWQVPGADEPELIDSRYIRSWKADPEDADDDGLPDDWQQSAGLRGEQVAEAARGAHGDADYDGLSNWTEWKKGTSPLMKDRIDFEKVLTCESWSHTEGRGIRDLVADDRFPARPDHVTFIDNLDFSDQGNGYGARLRGYLTAPEDGLFEFNLAGNNHCVLYLSESEDKFGKRVIATTGAGTVKRIYHTKVRQKSDLIELEAGKKYYIEVILQKRAEEITEEDTARDKVRKADHLSVAWRRPGRRDLSVIDAEYFSPYQPDPSDLDDDDLPDNWELVHGLDVADPTGDNGGWGDPDGDSLSNFEEYKKSLDPKIQDVHGTLGIALWEYWEVRGVRYANLLANSSYPKNPTGREWMTSLEGPQNFGMHFISRMRALVVAPESGEFTFAVAANHESKLWFGEDGTRQTRRLIASNSNPVDFRSWEETASQQSEPIQLEKGERYFIEFLHMENSATDHMSVAWKGPGMENFEVIGGEALIAYTYDPYDMDEDDLPDEWELAHGLPIDAIDTNSDFDGDGLTNMEEYLRGTRPDLADTDGDGVSDGAEVHLYGTNPLVADAFPPELVVDVELLGYDGKGHGVIIDVETGEILQEPEPPTATRWVEDASGSIVSLERSGDLRYTFTLADAGVYQIDLAGHSRGEGAAPVGITVVVDGVTVGEGEALPGPEPTRLSWLTQWLEPGEHLVLIKNHNVRGNVTLAIDAMDVSILGGPDEDGNGLPDWFEGLLLKQNHVLDRTLLSRSSPACVEGIARFLADVRLSSAGTAVPALEGPDQSWFANVPLSEEGVTSITASFESGALVDELSIQWVETNLADYAETPLLVRAGDALRLTVWDTSEKIQSTTFAISLGGEIIHQGSASKPITRSFETPGLSEYQVEVFENGVPTQSFSVTTKVLQADLGEPYHVPSNEIRPWTPPVLDADLVFSGASDLAVEESEGSVPRSFGIGFSKNRSARGVAVARLGVEGPVMDSVVFHGFFFAPSTWTRQNQMVRTLADGTRVYTVGYAIDGLIPPDLSIWIMMHVPGVTFENGDSWYELTAADFDENGIAELTFLKSPESESAYICHAISQFGGSPQEEEPVVEESAEEPTGESTPEPASAE